MDIKQIRKINLRALVDQYPRVEDFAEKAETSATYISQIFSEKVKAEVGDKLARKIEKRLGLEHGYMDVLHGPAGQGENVRMAGHAPDLRPIRAWNNEDELEGDDYVFLPRLDLSGGCGSGNVLWHIDEKSQPQAFRRSWCQQMGIDIAFSATCMADGDSMRERIQDGDSLVIDRSKTTILNGKVYLICYDDEYFVKRIFKVPGVGLKIVSDNPDKLRFPDWEIPAEKADSLIIVARVMGLAGSGGF